MSKYLEEPVEGDPEGNMSKYLEEPVEGDPEGEYV